MKDGPEAKGVSEVDQEPNKRRRNPTSVGALRPTALGSALRSLTLALATLTTGLIAGVFYAYAVDRKSTRLNSSHANISYAVFCLKKKKMKKCCDPNSNSS